jgi:hypothetical protein
VAEAAVAAAKAKAEEEAAAEAAAKAKAEEEARARRQQVVKQDLADGRTGSISLLYYSKHVSEMWDLKHNTPIKEGDEEKELARDEELAKVANEFHALFGPINEILHRKFALFSRFKKEDEEEAVEKLVAKGIDAAIDGFMGSDHMDSDEAAVAESCAAVMRSRAMNMDAVHTHHANCGKKRIRAPPVPYDAVPASGKIRKIDPCLVCTAHTNEDDEDDVSILCDGCNGACHLKCLGFKEAPKDDWYCDKCIAGNDNVPISHIKEKIGA